MKKQKIILFVGAVLLLLLISAICGAQSIDNAKGLKEFKFGASQSEITTLLNDEKIITNAKNAIIRKSKVQVEIGFQRVNVYVSFYNDKLYRLLIPFKNGQGIDLLKVFQAAYGPGRSGDDIIPAIYWLGKKVQMVYQESINGDGDITIIYTPISIEKEEAELKYNQNAAKGL